MTLKTGKTAARPGAMKLKFASLVNATALPVPPVEFGYHYLIQDQLWGMLGNDTVGDCVLAGGAHETMLFMVEGKNLLSRFSAANTIADYSAITGYNPADPNSDQGTDMVVAASYRRKTGLMDAAGNRHKIDAYAEITTGDLDQVALATYLFGACGVGFQLPTSAMDQFNKGEAFSVVPGSSIDGGHYMPCIGRTTSGEYVLVTWGKTVYASAAFMKTYMDEAVAYIDRNIIFSNTAKTPQGFSLATLDSFLAAL